MILSFPIVLTLWCCFHSLYKTIFLKKLVSLRLCSFFLKGSTRRVQGSYRRKNLTFLHNTHFKKHLSFYVSSSTFEEGSRRNLFWNLSPESRINQALEAWLQTYHKGSLHWRSSRRLRFLLFWEQTLLFDVMCSIRSI